MKSQSQGLVHSYDISNEEFIPRLDGDKMRRAEGKGKIQPVWMCDFNGGGGEWTAIFLPQLPPQDSSSFQLQIGVECRGKKIQKVRIR